MLRSLVGSEMCIRDSPGVRRGGAWYRWDRDGSATKIGYVRIAWRAVSGLPFFSSPSSSKTSWADLDVYFTRFAPLGVLYPHHFKCIFWLAGPPLWAAGPTRGPAGPPPGPEGPVHNIRFFPILRTIFTYKLIISFKDPQAPPGGPQGPPSGPEGPRHKVCFLAILRTFST